MTLAWTQGGGGEWLARSGATTYAVISSWRLPDVRKWDVWISHAEMRGADGDEILKYQGWGHDVDDAKALAQLIADAPIGGANELVLEWMRRHQRELAEEVRL
ncbi:hypothetical protein [Mycolicibacterium komossense]|uniref:Uncharacterized protein n=1 Tax=Mycolicibacterium komossense TaxID=1779 RepID=A0ABT3CMG6_9MYCO|nr:hypothetical protein [Mycolicibacterium komossense]MCV7230679.1 hypothetical protein [Mycolicibacterium komossense]